HAGTSSPQLEVSAGQADGRLRRNGSVFTYQLDPQRLLTEVRISGRDRVHRLDDFPLLVFYRHRALHQSVAAPFESPQAPRRAQLVEMAAALASRRNRFRRRWS